MGDETKGGMAAVQAEEAVVDDVFEEEDDGILVDFSDYPEVLAVEGDGVVETGVFEGLTVDEAVIVKHLIDERADGREVVTYVKEVRDALMKVKFRMLEEREGDPFDLVHNEIDAPLVAYYLVNEDILKNGLEYDLGLTPTPGNERIEAIAYRMCVEWIAQAAVELALSMNGRVDMASALTTLEYETPDDPPTDDLSIFHRLELERAEGYDWDFGRPSGAQIVDGMRLPPRDVRCYTDWMYSPDRMRDRAVQRAMRAFVREALDRGCYVPERFLELEGI